MIESRRSAHLIAAIAAASLTAMTGLRASAIDYTVTVSAPNHDYREAPVQVVLNAPRDFAGVALFEQGSNAPTAVQSWQAGEKVRAMWIVRNLNKGDSRKYRLTFEKVSRPVSEAGVII